MEYMWIIYGLYMDYIWITEKWKMNQLWSNYGAKL